MRFNNILNNILKKQSQPHLQQQQQNMQEPNCKMAILALVSSLIVSTDFKALSDSIVEMFEIEGQVSKYAFSVCYRP
jgi:hypothetical protein